MMKHWLLGAVFAAAWPGFAAAPELTAVADPLESYYPVQGRVEGTEAKSHLNLLHREFGLAALSLYNPEKTTMYCRITVSGFAGLKVTLREAAHIRARLGQLPADVLPELSKDGVVAVPAGENRQIFLEFDTRNGKAGTYRGSVKVVNLKDNSEITLEDLLGPDYINIANESIKAQIDADSSGLYFDEEMGGFTTITPETNFYINEAGNPVIVFQKYEIAAGAAGMPEFEITR